MNNQDQSPASVKADSPPAAGSVEGELVREAFKAYIAGMRTHQRPAWPDGESIFICGLYQHKYTKYYGCVIEADFSENSVTVWFDLCRRWTGTKQDFNEQFSDVILSPNTKLTDPRRRRT